MSWLALFKAEFKAILTNPAIVITVFGGIVFYSFLYPLPYSNQLPREQKIVVVNLDHSQLSRKIEFMVDATPQVKIAGYANSIAEAEQRIKEGEVSGFLQIPADFYRDLLQGRSPTLSYGGDASYFLVYGTIAEGVATVSGTLGAEVKVSQLLISGQALPLASKQYNTVRLSTQPVFNPTMGYINYVVPAVFVLILHQTLLIGAGILGATQSERYVDDKKNGVQNQVHYWLTTSPLKLLTVRVITFSLLYVPLVMYYFGFSFNYYGISRLASMTSLWALIIPFLISVASLGVVIGQLVPRRELATLVVLVASLPLVFSAGFIWPTTAMPVWINWLAQWAPSTAGIQGFVQMNQMGASLYQVADKWQQLWVLSLLYFILAWWLLIRRQQKVLA
ncbi:ABC transporter permease [Vibrio sp. SS-MA-C1-2]|uniref:ABC transporter permease n=1 Tax=Vibrio sp. SS-MA-C1-2 TaxID=2908646 RepID=UPI001F3CB928|nr:ABC transporter permease [Vibrio sp. SS-MA-C1-2]UJF17557.1 ABC transporter permease [Vibrio sp. SS-MA-C1-2]